MKHPEKRMITTLTIRDLSRVILVVDMKEEELGTKTSIDKVFKTGFSSDIKNESKYTKKILWLYGLWKFREIKAINPTLWKALISISHIWSKYICTV